MKSSIKLQWKKREGGGGKTERVFLDFMIDGESLWEKFDTDFISCLGWHPSEHNAKAVTRLLRKKEADFPDERRSLYICPECADLGCGAISVVIERAGDEIIWRDFGFQNNYDGEVYFDDFTSLERFAFDATEYYFAINSASEIANH